MVSFSEAVAGAALEDFFPELLFCRLTAGAVPAAGKVADAVIGSACSARIARTARYPFGQRASGRSRPCVTAMHMGSNEEVDGSGPNGDLPPLGKMSTHENTNHMPSARVDSKCV